MRWKKSWVIGKGFRNHVSPLLFNSQFFFSKHVLQTPSFDSAHTHKKIDQLKCSSHCLVQGAEWQISTLSARGFDLATFRLLVQCFNLPPQCYLQYERVHWFTSICYRVTDIFVLFWLICLLMKVFNTSGLTYYYISIMNLYFLADFTRLFIF